MTLETFFQMIEAVAVVIAVGFAIIQLRQYEQRQAREAAMELLHSFQTPDFAKAINLVYGMPDGLSKAEVEERLGDEMHLVYAMTTM
jgi:acyl CoA:acetate/3-ketoacid CoA transferase